MAIIVFLDSKARNKAMRVYAITRNEFSRITTEKKNPVFIVIHPFDFMDTISQARERRKRLKIGVSAR